MTDAVPTPRKSTPGHGGKREGAGPKPGTRGTASPTADAYAVLAKAKAKRETYKAQLAELEYRKATGELLPADEVAAAWAEQIAIAKGRFMALPARLAPDLLNAKDMRAIEAALRDAIVTVMEELSGEPSGH